MASRVGGQDAPLYVLARLQPDGRWRLRETTGGAHRTWNELGEVEITQGWRPDEALVRVLAKSSLAIASGGGAVESVRRSPVRVLVEADAEAPWGHVRPLLDALSRRGPHLERFTLVLSERGLALDVDLPPPYPPGEVTPFQDITVKLFRENLEDPNVDHQYTMVRVGELKKIELPKGLWPKNGDEEDARRHKEDLLFEEVTGLIASAWEQQNKNPEVKGEIKTPFPKGQSVPHGDVMRVLDSFLAAGIQQVNFEGAAAPLMKKDGGGWEFNN